MSNALDQLVREVNTSPPERRLVAAIERTSLSADLKALLCSLAKVTLRVGEKVIAIGRRILAFVLDLVKAFPGMTMGVITALVISSLIAGIPLVGGVLAGTLGSLLLIIGVSMGALHDLTNDRLQERVDRLVDSFGALAGV